MRLAHITDLHVERTPTLGELFNKRFAGAVNLYVLGRRSHFTRAAQEALVAAVDAVAPDAIVCSGDLTATATEAEFVAARELLAPLVARYPFSVIPGNHDVYTGESVGRFDRHFGEWAGGGRYPYATRVGPVEVVAIDVSRPAILSNGRAPEEQLTALDALLAAGTVPALVMLHYPLRDRDGRPYGPYTRAIVNADAIEAVLRKHARVAAVLHGHAHHGYRTTIPRDGAPIPSFNPGASGYAHLPAHHRTAHFNVYELGEEGIAGVERHAFDGQAFVPEAGGAYATGG